MIRNSRFYDELRKLSRFGGDCYRAESNDVFAFGVRRLADLFADEVDETRCDLRQMIAEEVLHGGVRLVVGTIPQKTQKPDVHIPQNTDKETFRDVVDNIAAFLRSDTFADCHWSEEDMQRLHKKMVRTMCLAVWSQYGDGGKPLIAKGKVEGIEDAHYDVDDYFASYMGTTWQACRKADYPEFCQNMRFELDEDGRFKPDLMLANGYPNDKMYSEIIWTSLADNEEDLRGLLRPIFPYDNFENFFVVVSIKMNLQRVDYNLHATERGETAEEQSVEQNRQCLGSVLDNVNNIIDEEIPEELKTFFSSLTDKFGVFLDNTQQNIQKSQNPDTKYLEETAKSLKHEKRIAKLRATTAEKRAAKYLELLNAKDIDKELLRQLKELQEELEQMKMQREEELERAKAEARSEVFREIETQIQPPLSLLQQAGAGSFVSVLLQMLQVFAYIPEMMEIISRSLKAYQEQVQQQPAFNGIIINGGTNTVLPAATNITQQYGGAAEEKPNQFDPAEPLSYFIHDADLRKQVIDIAENQCTRANNVKKMIYDLLINRGLDEGMLRSSEFLKALKPHLLLMPNIDISALQRAFRENN